MFFSCCLISPAAVLSYESLHVFLLLDMTSSKSWRFCCLRFGVKIGRPTKCLRTKKTLKKWNTSNLAGLTTVFVNSVIFCPLRMLALVMQKFPFGLPYTLINTQNKVKTYIHFLKVSCSESFWKKNNDDANAKDSVSSRDCFWI